MIKPRSKQIDIINEMNNTQYDKKLIVYSKEKNLLYFFLENGRLVSFYIDSTDTAKVGDYYVGIISKYNKSLNGYFINISKNETVYAPCPSKTPIITNRQTSKSPVEGDYVIVKIKKEAYKEKRANSVIVCSEDIKAPGLADVIDKGMSSVIYTKLFSGNTYLNDITAKYPNEQIRCICNDLYAFDYISQNYSGIINAELYNSDKIRLSALYNLKKLFSECIEKKIWLKSGGYIFIEPTEAMTVIDVNSGKNTGKDRDKVIFDTNVEAIKEAVIQIRSRDLSGIIVIDLINLKSHDKLNELQSILENEIKEQLNDTVLVDITKLQIAEITRKKTRPNIYELVKKVNPLLEIF